MPYDRPMLEVTGFIGTDKIVSLSPFCAKLDVYLRMTGLEYRYLVGDPRKSPTGKLPYLRDNTTILSDSQLIIEYLTETYKVDIDDGLTVDELAQAHMLRRTVEESLYFHILYAGWVDEDGFKNFGSAFGKMLPGMIRPLLMPVIRKSQRRALHGQGTGRHSRETIVAFADADLKALTVVLGERNFMLGEKPRSIDAVCSGFLECVLEGPETMLTDVARQHGNLVAYCARMRERYPDANRPAGELES